MKLKQLTPKQKHNALAKWLVEKKSIQRVMAEHNCCERALWYWKSRWKGTPESLKRDTSKPRKRHPNAHTRKERKAIERLLHQNPTVSRAELYGMLRLKYAYARTLPALNKFIKKNLSHLVAPQLIIKHISKNYNTPTMLGIKTQIDIKYVPKECYIGKIHDIRFYQFTMIDEATRERFIYPYANKCSNSAYDFVQRALMYFGYLPYIIQSDNDYAFVHPKGTGENKIHLITKLVNKLRIRHMLIRPYTPRHNGKVERSHRTDNKFYSNLKFSTLAELRRELEIWNKRYNNKPHSAIRNRFGKQTWQSPIQKRAEFLEQLAEQQNNLNLEFEVKSKQDKPLQARNKTDVESTKLEKRIIKRIRFIARDNQTGKYKLRPQSDVPVMRHIEQPPLNPYPKPRLEI
ncbi:MAG: DDE-type integrase/transposase/recombinase [Firmicutes bacterium]|nr:DDE-type integrase/transposase/recombinase [Bacillota bacterium]